MRIAIISGTSITRSEALVEWGNERVTTAYGEVEVKVKGGLVAMNRHGFERALPPHAINHRANVEALCQLGIDSVVTLSSVGSVDAELQPGSLVSCSDYLSFAPRTFIDDRMSAFAPVVGNPLLERVARNASCQPILRDKVYFQTRGPRFETKAEVRALRLLGADVVGMTFANEADLILERGLGLTSFCMVDNYAHGVGDQALSEEAFQQMVARNQLKIDEFLGSIVDTLRS